VRLVPRTKEFYDLLTAAGKNAREAASVAESIFGDWPNGPEHAQIKALENEGDRITTELLTNLNQQLIAPFDPEDLYMLIGAVDDVVDAIEYACELLGLYDVQSPTKQSLELCGILVAASTQLDELLAGLRGRSGSEERLLEIKRLEDDGDRVKRAAVASLFKDDGIDPLIIVRWKDIYESLEEAIDACETVAHVVGNILVKNA
jgi:predicted phosphate transport protein (TIGR00153 family)